MDIIETLDPIEEVSFTKEIAKSFAYTAVATAGAWAGIIAVGLTFEAASSLISRLKDNKTTTTE